jgi:type I restriction enzyme S subunit
MQIVLPPIEKQNEIATYISDIRTQAKQLQREAAQILVEAKAEIEHMIKGEVA